MLEAYPNKLLVRNLDRGVETSTGGIIMGDPTGQSAGVKARWAQVWQAGDGIDKDIKPGHWILIQHGRWTRAIDWEGEHLYMADPQSVLAVSTGDTRPDFNPVGAEAVQEYQYDANQFRDYAGDRFTL